MNNAGIGPRVRKDILEVGEESMNEVMNVNLVGPFFLTQRVARAMIDLIASEVVQTPKIVNIGSISAFTQQHQPARVLPLQSGCGHDDPALRRSPGERGHQRLRNPPGDHHDPDDCRW